MRRPARSLLLLCALTAGTQAAGAPVGERRVFDNVEVSGIVGVSFHPGELVFTGAQMTMKFPGGTVMTREIRLRLRQTRVATAQARGGVVLDMTFRSPEGEPMQLHGTGETLDYAAATEQATLAGRAVTVTLRDAAGGELTGTGAAWMRVYLKGGQFDRFEARAPEDQVMRWTYTASPEPAAEEAEDAPGR